MPYAEAGEIHRTSVSDGPRQEPNEQQHEADRECRPVAAVLSLVCASGRARREGE